MARTDDGGGDSPQRAAILIARCRSSPTQFGVRLAHDGIATWWATWAFEISPARAAREGYSTTLSGSFQLAAGFPGCPGCGNPTFVHCSDCQTLSCWSGSSGAWTCGFCRASGVLSPLTDVTATKD